MRLRDAERVSRAIQTLSAGASLDAIVDRVYDLTEGSLALDRATLHRIARGKTQQARSIDSPSIWKKRTNGRERKERRNKCAWRV